ncbi:hypothetical protein NNJEOMEG_01559 [Fundidesulfovibrio magnetotacticus]|uniref:Tetratricopeptide repeat protein n=1 Tax=Fundidesulfovibrio magnetotacticus TaxID=2730080 RepID=A0A6V8LZR8_9BACT|nr:hypothetical protein [Fundidesulfovibrio magnetotacticus]GFK93725.1 hypothetical protein NNJEOMEG_01559 [Fundidesulfovibrio magnetotacticus]
MKRLLALILASLFTAAIAWAAPPARPACVAALVEGGVLLSRQEAPDVGLERFRKLLPGDRITLEPGATLRLSFLRAGKAEAWRGPARLVVEEGGTKGTDPAGAPLAPAITPLELTSVSLGGAALLDSQPELISGQITVRSGRFPPADVPLDDAGKKDLDRLETRCDALRKALPPGDATADFALAAGLDALGQQARAVRLLKDLLARDEANEALADLLKEVLQPR